MMNAMAMGSPACNKLTPPSLTQLAQKQATAFSPNTNALNQLNQVASSPLQLGLKPQVSSGFNAIA